MFHFAFNFFPWLCSLSWFGDVNFFTYAVFVIGHQAVELAHK
jgi:hypothetical protein